ncbi:fumarylacetoacetate hydrolase [Gloeophyllum trabeum ATCC 11539]|uniref:Fumarylacetoacetate hydrolase n=1 Tax=Gloeophyllum trabeum (strain ATCC 11539 / FP-39264 / Madison 617) TaxID=670483 RepID=S7Q621_GLOTA|nr:fumarylacetoacetate hydrolase [Gloeophyllum trabeum ATCC 11539]EPQ54913.1 fumarylacetoacetate hydrolase [Gloeophyllum trabeum ATCC 11539]
MPEWTHLIRFVAADDGKTYFGPLAEDRIFVGQLVDTAPDALRRLGPGAQAYVVTGDPLGAHTLTRDTKTVGAILAPLARAQVPLIKCVGLNYAKHAAEGKFAVSDWPTMFIKPRTSLAGPADIPIPKCVQDKTLDFEAELCFVIAKDCRDVPLGAPDWEQYVAGYTIGNDLSWRRAQLDPKLSGSQICMGKGPDNFAPIGPVLVSAKAIDASDLAISLRVNGKTMQDSRTSDLIHKIPDIISRFSQGTTLERGTVIMTGTPEGVGCLRNPPVYLDHGDKVEIEIEGLGILRHGIHYE